MRKLTNQWPVMLVVWAPALALLACSGQPTTDDDEPTSPGNSATPTPGGHETPTQVGNETPTPGGNDTPTPGGNQTPTPGGSATTPPEPVSPTPTMVPTPQPTPTPQDADHDGVPFPEDCDDNNPAVYPAAMDFIGDGIDQNCNGQDLMEQVSGIGYPIDAGVPASTASLHYPTGVITDSQGNVYIADTSHLLVRKIDPAGVITTVAGNGLEGSDGDGGPATEARVVPYRLALDDAGNLYICESYHYRVRMVDKDGIIWPFVGTGEMGNSGDGGPADEARLQYPRGIAWSPNGFYIADEDANRIRKVDPDGIISTFAGTGEAGYNGNEGVATSIKLDAPDGVVVSDSGAVFIADDGNDRIRKVVDGKMYLVVGGGSASATDGAVATGIRLSGVRGLTFDDVGNLYFASSSSVGKVDTAGIYTLFAGKSGSHTTGSGDGGPATKAELVNPWDVGVVSDGTVVIVDNGDARLRAVDTSGIITTAAGVVPYGFSGDGGPAADAALYYPTDVAASKDGRIFIGDSNNRRVRMIDINGIISTVAGNGTSTYVGDGVHATETGFKLTRSVALDSDGNLYIADYEARILKVDGAGIITTVAGTGVAGFSGDGGPATQAKLKSPALVRVSPAGELIIGDTGNYRIRRIDKNGVIQTIAGIGSPTASGDDGPATQAGIGSVNQLAYDGSGNLLFTDILNLVIRRIDTSGIITTIAGGGSTPADDGVVATQAKLLQPRGLAIDSRGELYFIDLNFLRRLDPSGVLYTLAGAPYCTSGNSEGPLNTVSLCYPFNVTLDASGGLYICDTYNQRFLRLSP